MELVDRETDRSGAAAEFIALDIGDETDLSVTNTEFKLLESFIGKSLERERGGEERNGDPNSFTSTGVAGRHEKQAVFVHAASDGSPKEQFHATTPTAGGGKRRRGGRRVPAWRDPRKILFVFAALSSVGTLILLYFTLSMGKMTGGQADGR